MVPQKSKGGTPKISNLMSSKFGTPQGSPRNPPDPTTFIPVIKRERNPGDQLTKPTMKGIPADIACW